MNKNTTIGLLVGGGIIVLLGLVSVWKAPSTVEGGMNTQAIAVSEKIEVVHFHGTQQCWSCITVGEFALKTIKEKFPEEYKQGIIVFRDVNGELPENRNLVLKYQARGSSLFVNSITGGQDSIAEDVAVWRLVASEQQFMTYFEAKLKKLLGKSQKYD